MTTPVRASTESHGGTPGGPKEAAPIEPIADSPRVNKASFHIIVSDDNSDVANTIGTYLVTEGFTVSTFDDHKKAQAALSTKPFNLLIANQSAGGIKLIDDVKQTYPKAKVLLCTGNSLAEKGNADDVLIKPFQGDTLKNKVLTLLEIKE